MSATPLTSASRPHLWDYCHDDMHVTGDSCPNCGGYLMACEPATHQTTSTGSAQTDTPLSVAAEARTPGAEVEPLPAPSRPGVNPEDRVTYGAPFAIDRTITDDDIHLVTFTLTDDATHTHVRDLADIHIGDLILLSRLRQQARKHRQLGLDGSATAATREARRIEDRLSGALQSHATTQWELTLTQAEQLLEDLDDAATEPETCAVGTCTGYASVDGYCGPHADGI